MGTGEASSRVVGLRHGDSCDVAARPRETLHQSFLDRVAGSEEYDWDRPGRFLHDLGRFGPTDDNDIEIESHHFRDRVAQQFGLPFPSSPFDDDGATLDIAELPQPLAQNLRANARVPRKKDTDSRQARRLLCFGGERHGEKATCNAADERAPIHY